MAVCPQCAKHFSRGAMPLKYQMYFSEIATLHHGGDTHFSGGFYTVTRHVLIPKSVVFQGIVLALRLYITSSCDCDYHVERDLS